LENGEEDIFPDPMSQSIAEGWRTGVAKEFERQYAGFVPQSAALCRSAAHHAITDSQQKRGWRYGS
jgi:hypothetical protein